MSAPRIAVVGVGHMGTLHARKIRQLAEEGVAELAGLRDVDSDRAEELARELGTRSLESLEAVIDCADAACVAAPSHLHGEIAARLLEGDLDLLVEKPLATERAAARDLIEAARGAGRILQVGHIERFSPAFHEVRPVIRRPRFIEVHRLGPYPGRATDASVVLDLMIHDLDLISTLAGAEVERVEAVGIPVLSPTCDIANARVRFANGCIANLTASRVSAERMRKIRLFQPDAYLSIDFDQSRITVMRREGVPGAGEAPKISSERLEFDEADALLAQARAFANAVARREAPQVTGEDAYIALDLALRIEEAIPPIEDLA